MTHDLQTVREDLAFMKALAQEGRRAPLLNGRSLLAAGVIYGLTSLAAWAVWTGVVHVSPWWRGGVWAAATAIYLPFIWLSKRSACDRPGATAVTNVAVKTAWRALGYSILAMVLVNTLAAWREHSTMVWDTFPCLVLVFYGAGWMVSAAMSDRRWIVWVAAGCFVAALLVGYLSDHLLVFPVFAAAFFLLVALPGWLLMRAEPSDLV